MAQVKSLQTGIKFKDTPIGKVPVDWGIRKIEDIGDIVTGSTPSTKNREYFGNKFMFVTPTDIGNYKYVKETERRLSDKGMEISRRIPKDSVMVVCIASIGKLAIASEVCTTNQQINSIICNETTNPHFIYYLMHSKISQLLSLSGKTAVPIVNKSLFSKMLIQLPPLPEQKKIAEILTAVDDAIEETDRIIEKTKELKKGLMQKLLTRGIGHKKFKKTEIGEIPAEWRIARMDEVAKIERGKFQFRPRNEPRFYGGKYPFVQTGDVTNSGGRIRKYSQTLNDEGLAISRLFPKGTVLITIAANIGDTAVAEFELAFPDSLIGIIPYESLNNYFLEYYLRTRKMHFNKLSTQSAQKNINLETLKPYPVPVPSRKEQHRIVVILSELDRAEEEEVQRKNSLESLKKSLMQVLLTGRVRVKLH